MADNDYVTSVRIPRAVYDRVQAWRTARDLPISMGDALRHLLERGLTEVERKRTGAKGGER